MRGMGACASAASSRTMSYSSGASASLTGFDRVAAMAMRSLDQYMMKLKTKARTRAIVAPCPPPIHAPTATNNAASAEMRIQVFTLLIPIMSPSSNHCSEGVRIRPADLRQGGGRRELCEQVREDPHGDDRSHGQNRNPRYQDRRPKRSGFRELDEEHLTHDRDVVIQADDRVEHHDDGQPGLIGVDRGA